MKIDIKKPCRENWDEMSENKKGRFCASCSQNVYDFTDFKNSDIISIMKSENNICGKFGANQLQLNVSMFKNLAVGVLLTGGTVIHANAQEINKTSTDKNNQHTIEDTLKRTFRIGAPASINASNEPLYIFNGKIINNKTFKKINTKDIININILKGNEAIKQYGKAGENGVILIEGKKNKKDTKSNP